MTPCFADGPFTGTPGATLLRRSKNKPRFAGGHFPAGREGEREWAEALEAGAFDLLAPPYKKHEVLAVLEQAVESDYPARRVRERPALAWQAS